MSGHTLRFAAVTALSATLAAPPADAVRRAVRTLGVEDGLPSVKVTDVAQDADGFLWIATSGALVRYDGARMRRWAPEILASRWIDVATGPRGEVVVRLEDGRTFTVVGGGAEPLAGPDGVPLGDVRDLAFDDGGALWLLTEEALHRRDSDGAWASLPAETLGGETPRRIRPATGGVFALTRDGIWRVTRTLGVTRQIAPERLHKVPGGSEGIVDVVERDDELVVLLWSGTVVSLRDGEPRTLFALPGRGVDLELRDDTLWVGFDRYLAALAPDGALEVMGPEDDLPSGGPLLADREGSLWMGTFSGLLQFSEPGAIYFGEKDGLPSDHVRSLALGEDSIWVSTWHGTGRIAHREGGWVTETVPQAETRGLLCTGAGGAIWAAAAERLIEIRDGTIRSRAAPGARGLGQCGIGAGGRLWLPTGDALYLLEPGRAPVAVRVAREEVSPGEAFFPAALETRNGRLFVAVGERVCEAQAAAVASGADTPWRCASVPGAVIVGSLVELPSGALWLSSERTGVHRLRDDRWEAIGDPAKRVGILALEPAVAGGVWILGLSHAERIVERPESPLGWEVVERIAAWHGLETGSGWDVLEIPGGDLWLTTTSGVVRIPAAARRDAFPVPTVRMVGATAGGRSLPLEGRPQVPYQQRQIQIDFAALSFRDPSLLRYRVRTSGTDAWEEMQGAPTFRFLDLSPGRYRAEVQASLDGRRWSEEPAIYTFIIAPPWYATWWVRAVALLALVGGLAMAYRIRVRHLLDLERQRARIAMDLHDELGSGLGSVGILASVLGKEGLDATDRAAVSEQISRTASELGTALSDIVWSLRPGPQDLRQLAVHLAERGNRLFADDETRFITELPTTWPSRALSAPVRRNVLLVAIEALHNARRHARASQVVLTLMPRGSRWSLRVADDGRGLPESIAGTGLGFLTMWRRAAEIGADLRIETATGQGTGVELTFSPRARSRPVRGGRPPRSLIVRQTARGVRERLEAPS